jgi:hypothetical protein
VGWRQDKSSFFRQKEYRVYFSKPVTGPATAALVKTQQLIYKYHFAFQPVQPVLNDALSARQPCNYIYQAAAW